MSSSRGPGIAGWSARGEDLKHACGGGCGTAAIFGVERQLGQAAVGHRDTDVAFDERLDEHRDEVAAQQAFDSGGSRRNMGATRWVPLSWAWRFSTLSWYL